MKLLALTFLVIGNLAATEAFALQPLTRADCVKAALVWNDSANVCVGGAGTVSARPLIKSDCGRGRHVVGRECSCVWIGLPAGATYARVRSSSHPGPAPNEKRLRSGRHDVGRHRQCVRRNVKRISNSGHFSGDKPGCVYDPHHHRQDHSKDDRLC